MTKVEIWILIAVVQFVILLCVGTWYSMTRGGVAVQKGSPVRNVVGPQLPSYVHYPQVSEPLRGPVIDVRTSTAPALPPFRTYQPSHQPRQDFQKVGYAYNDSRTKVLPVYSRPAPRNPSRMQYYTMAEGTDISMAIQTGNKECLSDVGCEELQSGDVVKTEAADEELKVTIYDHV